MYPGDLLSALDELHWKRGVPWTEIAKALGIARQQVHYLRRGDRRITPKFLARASKVLPDLLVSTIPLKHSKPIPPGPGDIERDMERNEDRIKRLQALEQ